VIHVTPRRALTCVCVGGSFPLAFWAGWVAMARYVRRQGL
jgi:hypothetical protein